MKHSTKLLGMTAAVALLSAPAMAHQSKKVDLDNDGHAEAIIKYSNSKDAFHRLDANHNNRISLEEFKDNTMHDNEASVFAMIDQDQSGYITRAELENNSKMGGQKVSSARTTTNLKTKSGQPIGSMDEKYYNNDGFYVYNPFYDDPELKNDVDYDIDNPFVDDPELANDTNWEWPEDWAWNETVDPNKPLFNQLDTNKNGMISQREFMKGTIHDNEAEVFAMLDKNQNGSISPYEIKAYSKMGGRK